MRCVGASASRGVQAADPLGSYKYIPIGFPWDEDVFFPTWMVDSYVFFVGTYTVRPMDFTNGWMDDSYPTSFYSTCVSYNLKGGS